LGSTENSLITIQLAQEGHCAFILKFKSKNRVNIIKRIIFF